MNRYKIYCNEVQTKKAVELGAPIETSPYFEQLRYETDVFFVKDELCYWYPTAEEMIGWLEEQLGENSSIYMVQDSQCWWSANVYDSCNYKIFYNNDYHSRKEATLAAIDAALEYLTNNKK